MRLHVAPRLRRNPDASDASNTRWRAVTAVYSAPGRHHIIYDRDLLAGIIGYRALPVSALPEVDYPTIQVVTLYPGASPDVVTSSITAPLERQFGQMSGLKQMASQSSGGASVITLQFQLTLPLDVAEQEVQAAINAATNLLPSDLPYPPIYNKVNPADPPILTLAVTATAIPMTQVEDMVETRIAQKISQVTGVGLVTLSGGQRPAVRVKLNAPAVAALGLDSETIRTAISNANVNSAKGSLDGPTRSVTLSANDQMKSAEEYRDLIIAYQMVRPSAYKMSPPLNKGRKITNWPPGPILNQQLC